MEKKNKPKPSAKKAPKAATKKAPPAKAPAVAPAVSGKRPTMEKPSKKTALRDSILARKAATKPIAFSLDEVRAIAKTVTAKAESTAKSAKVAVKPSAATCSRRPLDKPRLKAEPHQGRLPRRHPGVQPEEDEGRGRHRGEGCPREVQALPQAPDRPAQAPDRGHRAPLRGDAQALRQGRRRRPLVLRPAHGGRRDRHV